MYISIAKMPTSFAAAAGAEVEKPLELLAAAAHRLHIADTRVIDILQVYLQEVNPVDLSAFQALRCQTDSV